MLEKKSKKEVARALKELLRKYKLDKKLDVDELENEVFNCPIEDNNRLLTKMLTHFSKKNLSVDEFNEVLKIWSDFWNYLPHKGLDGKSPYDMVKEAQDNDPSPVKDNSNMRVRVGGAQMSESEFKKMLAKMEKEQEPFKKQIEKELLPAYEKFLETQFKQKTVIRHIRIAELFLQRALFLGFVRYDLISTDFAFCEFSIWWQSHVAWELSESAIDNSVKKFTDFVRDSFGMDLYDDCLFDAE